MAPFLAWFVDISTFSGSGACYGLQSLADFVVRCLIYGEVLADRILHIVGIGDHRSDHACIVDYRFEFFLPGITPHVPLFLAVDAHVGEIVDEEGFAGRGWCNHRDFLALLVFEAEDEITALRDLRGDSFRAEAAGIDAMLVEQPFAIRCDFVRNEPACARTVGFKIGHELGEEQFSHRRAADITGADKQDFHDLFLKKENNRFYDACFRINEGTWENPSPFMKHRYGVYLLG